MDSGISRAIEKQQEIVTKRPEPTKVTTNHDD